MVYKSCQAIRIYSRILNPFCRRLALSFLVLSSENLIILNSYYCSWGLKREFASEDQEGTLFKIVKKDKKVVLWKYLL